MSGERITCPYCGFDHFTMQDKHESLKPFKEHLEEVLTMELNIRFIDSMFVRKMLSDLAEFIAEKQRKTYVLNTRK